MRLNCGFHRIRTECWFTLLRRDPIPTPDCHQKSLVSGLGFPLTSEGIPESSHGTEPQEPVNEKRTETTPKVTSVRPSASDDNDVSHNQKVEAGGIEPAPEGKNRSGGVENGGLRRILVTILGGHRTFLAELFHSLATGIGGSATPTARPVEQPPANNPKQ